MLGRSFDRLCNNTSSTQFAGAVGFLMLHILLALMTASNGWVWATVFWLGAVVGSATRLDAYLVHDDGLDGVSDTEAFVILGGMTSQVVAFAFVMIAMPT